VAGGEIQVDRHRSGEQSGDVRHRAADRRGQQHTECDVGWRASADRPRQKQAGDDRAPEGQRRPLESPNQGGS
jgi:hypothetical protein